jgi:hypothetical protein
MPANPNHGGLWTDQIWQAIDDAANSAAMALCVGQQAFHSVQLAEVASVPVGTLDSETLTYSEGEPRPYIEIAANFTLPSAAVNDDPTGRVATGVATRAATRLAGAIDTIYFEGKKALAKPIRIASGKVYAGLLDLAKKNPVKVPPYPVGEPTTNSGIKVLEAVQSALVSLAGRNQTPDFVLILGAGQADGKTAQTLVTASQINGVATPTVLSEIVTGGIFSTTALPANVGLLAARGGNPTTVYYSDKFLTEFVARKDDDGSFVFRVFYRTQIVPSDEDAFAQLEFEDVKLKP